MVKLSSFFPFSSFLRITQEFHEKKAFVKMKSLTYEREFEFEYKDVGEISESLFAQHNQMTFGAALLALVAATLTVGNCLIYTYPVLLRIGQVLYGCGVLLWITGFRKSWHVQIADKNDTILTYIEENRQNRGLVRQAIETIKSNSENAKEVSAANPFPEEKPAFEHIYYEPAELRKTIDRFYENEIIGFQQGIGAQSVYLIKYSQLNGNIYRGKSGSDLLGPTLTTVILVMSIVVGFVAGFSPAFQDLSLDLGYFVIVLFALGFIAWLLGFIKREMIGLYGKNGNVTYWTYVNSSNKEKVEEIIRFIQSRVTPVTNHELLKEQV